MRVLSWLSLSIAETLGPLGVVAIVLYVEAVRRSGSSPPIPFLLLFAALVVSATLGSIRSALISTWIASGFIIYASLISFGRQTLTGGPVQVVLGIALIHAIGITLGLRADKLRRLSARQDERIRTRTEALVTADEALRESEAHLAVTQRIAHVGSWVRAEAEARQQQELAASAAAVKSILETAPDPILVADSEGRILQANAAATKVFGWEPDELVGRNLADLAGSVIAQEHSKYMQHYAATGMASTPDGLVLGRTRESIGRRRSGEEFPAEVSVAELDDGSGERRFVGVVRDISERKHDELELRRLNGELADRAQERLRLMQQILGAYEEERRRVAYDIHDGPAQRLTGAHMYLESFNSGRRYREDDELEHYLERAGLHLDGALREMQRIMSDLRPALLDDLGLADALRTTLAAMVNQTRVQFDYTARGDGPRLDPSIEIALFRIAQEAVGNALNHARTPRIAVTVEISATRATLCIRDWGEGFDVEQAAGARPGGLRLGLVGMRERAELLGGTFSIESAAGVGTTVTVSVPARTPVVPASQTAGLDDA